jgi:hypothetical protein
MSSVVGDRIDALRTYCLTLLNAEREEGGRLEGVKKVVYGSTFSIEDLDLPGIWIRPEPYTPNEEGGFTSTEHRFIWTFYSSVYNTKPSEGAIESERLTFTVREILRQNPQPPGMDLAKSTVINPALRLSPAKLVYTSSVDMEFFAVIEE